MFKSSDKSLSSTQTLITMLTEVQEITKAVIKLLSQLEKHHVEIPVPSWIMNQTASAKIALIQIYQACVLIQTRSVKTNAQSKSILKVKAESQSPAALDQTKLDDKM